MEYVTLVVCGSGFVLVRIFSHAYIYEVQLHLLVTALTRGTYTPGGTCTCTHKRYSTVHLQYDLHLHHRGTATSMRYIYEKPTSYNYTYTSARLINTYEVHLQLPVTWNSLQIRHQTIRTYDASTNNSDVRVRHNQTIRTYDASINTSDVRVRHN